MKIVEHTKLGLFVIAGIAFLILTLYMIGRNRNLLGSTLSISVKMDNVNGLLPGNNVRFRGIDVGTVKAIHIADDTSIYVTLTIQQKYQAYIKQNSVASIGTDGLMGNKLININSIAAPAPGIKEGSVISSLPPIETDEMLRTLNTTNENIAVITQNLAQITQKLNSSNSLWSLLSDTSIATDLKTAVKDVRLAGENIAAFTADAENLMSDLRMGEGVAGSLLRDSTWKSGIDDAVNNMKAGSHDLAAAMNSLDGLIDEISKGKGTTGYLISDTVFRQKLFNTMSAAEEGVSRFSENMEALKHHFLFRRYFRKQEKEKLKQQSSSR